MDRTREGRAFHPKCSFCFTLLVSASALLLGPLTARAQIRPIELEGLIITGTPVPRTLGTEASHVTVLDGGELRARGLTRVVDALDEVTGLSVVQNGSYGSVASVFFRGAEADHLKVLVDGVEVNQNGGGVDLSGLLLSNVERIEVVRGPASALYGTDAMAGVINILTRRATGPLQGSVSFRGGSYGRREWGADLFGGSGSASYSLSVAQARSDGILAFNNQFQATTVSGSFFATPDGKTRLSFTGRYGDRNYHFPTDDSGNVVDRNAFTFGDELTLGVQADRILTDRLELRAAVRRYSWDGGSDDRPDGPEDNVGFYAFESRDTFHRTSADFRGNLMVWRQGTLSAGVEVQEERQRSVSESFSEFGPTSGQSRNRRSNTAYYAHLTSQGAAWSGNAGFRLEDNEQYGRFFTYQAGASYTLSRTSTRFRGNLGKGFREPAFMETASTGYTVGNPNLDPEQSRVWEVGVEQPLGRGGAQLSLTWFHQTLEDLIQYTFLPPEPGGPNFFNVARARSRGLEGTARFPLGSSLLTLGYTFLDTEVLDAGFDEGDGAVFVEGKPLIRRPRHQLNAGLVQPFSRGRLFGSVRWVSSRSDRDFTQWPATSVRLSPYALVSVGGEVSVKEAVGGWPSVDLQLRIENLLDEGYRDVFGYSAPGRAVLLGGKLRMGG